MVGYYKILWAAGTPSSIPKQSTVED